MKEILRIPNGIVPCHAEGHYCIDLTDPISGKVKERVSGKNHIFEQSIFSLYGNSWQEAINSVCLEMTDSTLDIDPDMPFIFGQTVGYGKPNAAGSGNYRGAYNAINQKLAATTLSSVIWKFQYDFTTAQANGTIGTIGLTHQHIGAIRKRPIQGFKPSAMVTTYAAKTCDGRYSYSCSTAGIITKYDNYLGTSTDINVSSTVGTASDSKTVGYASATGYYYIYAYGTTAANRRMYVFTDNTFSTLSATYSPSNITLPAGYPMYIYGNYAFCISDNYIYIADFVNNTAYPTKTISAYSWITYTEGVNSYYNHYFSYCSMAKGKYIITWSGTTSSYNYPTGMIFDMSEQALVGYITFPGGPCYYPAIQCPVGTTNFLPTLLDNDYGLIHNCAIAAKKLDTPITKTSANGLTVTYEVEVFW